MKKYNLFPILASLLLILPAFVSCDKDDDKDEPDEGKGTGVSNIIGTYKGTFDNVNVMGIVCDITGEYDLIIQKEANETDEVQVVFPECSYSVPDMGSNARTIPSITVNEVDVNVNKSEYSISKEKYEITKEGVKYSGTISGTIKGNQITLYYTMIPGGMGMPINFTFTGTLK
ncbi:MAG: calycin-like domain-containing protein [Muribaculaceae bacterium]|nr:calycin-like domain-containing protein [Muribaculaceae bacterium]